jgi:hypothetical protein
VTYWHGGGRILGDLVLPAEVTGRSRSGDDGVYVSTDRHLAETYASTVDEPTAWIYEVEPVGPLTPVPSLIPGAATISYRCASARILARYTIANARRAKYRASVARAGRLLR